MVDGESGGPLVALTLCLIVALLGMSYDRRRADALVFPWGVQTVALVSDVETFSDSESESSGDVSVNGEPPPVSARVRYEIVLRERPRASSPTCLIS